MTLALWSFHKWDSGYVDNRGRMRVYRPDYPRAWHYKTTKGYAFRYHIVWWLTTGNAIPRGYELHHKNGNELDDRFENLELLAHVAHAKHHAAQRSLLAAMPCTCMGCGNTFVIARHRLKEKGRGRFCSQACYHNTPRTASHKAAISRGLANSYQTGRR